VAEVALQTRRLALLLGADQKDEDEDGLCEDGALGVGRECVLTEERLEEAGHGYEILRKLESPNSNVRFSYPSLGWLLTSRRL
jgi:hypothetical protein